MSWSLLCLIVAVVFAAFMMLKVPEGPRLSFWGAVVFFVILSWIVSVAPALPLFHR